MTTESFDPLKRWDAVFDAFAAVLPSVRVPIQHEQQWEGHLQQHRIHAEQSEMSAEDLPEEEDYITYYYSPAYWDAVRRVARLYGFITKEP